LVASIDLLLLQKEIVRFKARAPNDNAEAPVFGGMNKQVLQDAFHGDVRGHALDGFRCPCLADIER
jgi:hypothetical protein